MTKNNIITETSSPAMGSGSEQNKNLTQKQQRFVDEYSKDAQAEQAAIRAGYKASHAKRLSLRLLSMPHIIHALETALQRRIQQQNFLPTRTSQHVTEERIVKELAAIGFTSIADLCQWDATGINLKNSSTLSPHQTAAIAEILESSTGKGGVRIKLHAKLKALEMLGRYFGMFSIDSIKENDAPLPLEPLSLELQEEMDTLFPEKNPD